MYPPMWGSSYWKVIHLTCLSYPMQPKQKDKTQIKIFLESICNVLPCPACRFHANQFILKYKPRVQNRISLLYWSFDFHNEVNKRTNKLVLSYAECVKHTINFNELDILNNDIKRVQDHKVISNKKIEIYNKNITIAVLSVTIIILVIASVIKHAYNKRKLN